MRVIKISEGETVKGSFKKQRKKKYQAIFNFEQEPWQRIRKAYQIGILILIIIFLVGFISPPIQNIRLLIALGILMLYILISQPVILPKKYFVKSVKINRQAITFEYFSLPEQQLFFTKNEVYFYIYSYDKAVEIEYSNHVIIFTNAAEMTDFFNKVVTIANLQFYKSTELGIGKELLKYKILKKRKGTNLPT